MTLTSGLAHWLCVRALVCVCERASEYARARGGFQTDSAVMALAKCQLLHSSISMAEAGRRLLLIDYGLYSLAIQLGEFTLTRIKAPAKPCSR